MDLKSKILANRENSAQGNFTVIGKYLGNPYVQEQQTTSTSMKFDSRTIRALGFKNWAKDAKPEEVADALENFQREAAEKAEAAEKTRTAADEVELIPDEAEILPTDEVSEPELGIDALGPKDYPDDVLSFFNGRSHADGVKAYNDYLLHKRGR